MNAKAKVAALLKVLNKDPRPALFGFRAPGIVRAGALLGIEERDDDDFLVRHAGRDIQLYGPRKELLEDWKPDGHWGISRMLMKSKGERAAEQAALRQAIVNISLLIQYGYDIAADARLKRFLDFAEPYLFGPVVRLKRITLQVSYLAALLTGSGAGALLPKPVVSLLESHLDAFMTRRKFAGPDLLKRAATLYHAVVWRQQRSPGEAALPRAALESISALLDEEHTQRLNALRTPSLAINWLHLCRLGVMSGYHNEHAAVHPHLQHIIDLQGKDGQWSSTRSDPSDDEKLFLTLEIVLVVKSLIENNPDALRESADAGDD